MKTEYFKIYSKELQRDIELKAFGHAGVPCIVFPPQDGRFYDFENFGMIEACHDYIEEKRVQFFCVDSIDSETISNENGDVFTRINLYEKYQNFVEFELAPFVLELNAKEQTKRKEIMTLGCSLGAYHALLALCRNPKLFHQVLGMSGIYNYSYFFGEQSDPIFSRNSPCDFIHGFKENDPKIKELGKGKIALCCGQGAWEHDMDQSLRLIEQVLHDKEIPAWIDYWGYDVSHDWSWWKQQIHYFLQFMV